jgi:KDO2-lipid IV(A) lauroyltransferase
MKNKGTLGSFLMIADQRPSGRNHRHWVNFLHHDTPVMTGTEQLARKFNYPVVFMSVERIKRGYYCCEFEMIEAEPINTPIHSITDKYMALLEARIKKQPEYWLWTHNRWKHQRPTQTN